MRKLAFTSLIIAASFLPIGGSFCSSASRGRIRVQPPSRRAVAIASINEKFDLWRGPYLRGANIWQKRVMPDDAMGPGPAGPPYSQQDFDELASWGANYANISHPGIFTERADYQIEEGVFQNLSDLIDKAERAGLFVVVSYRTGPGRNEAVFGGEDSTPLTKVWKNKAAQNAWVEMWRETARRLKDRKNVVGYDLMVEPDTKKAALWNRLASSITDAIRAIDSTTPILIGGADWSTVDSLDSLAATGDARTVYTVHQYEPSDYTQEGASSFSTNQLQDLYNRISSFETTNRVPIAINEFGVVRFARDADSFVSTQMAMIEGLGANHALWLWETSFRLDYDDFNFRRGPDPNNHVDVAESDLIRVIKADWSKNVIHFPDVRNNF
jgi:hypothetical protein